jgi:hypothetical protein
VPLCNKRNLIVRARETEEERRDNMSTKGATKIHGIRSTRNASRAKYKYSYCNKKDTSSNPAQCPDDRSNFNNHLMRAPSSDARALRPAHMPHSRHYTSGGIHHVLGNSIDKAVLLSTPRRVPACRLTPRRPQAGKAPSMLVCTQCLPQIEGSS